MKGTHAAVDKCPEGGHGGDLVFATMGKAMFKKTRKKMCTIQTFTNVFIVALKFGFPAFTMALLQEQLSKFTFLLFSRIAIT